MKPDVRDRLFLPLIIPLGILGVIALAAFSFGMLLLFNPMSVSLTIAAVVAAGILGAFGLQSAQQEELTRPKRMVIAGAVIAPLAVGVLVATDVIAVDAPKMAEVEPHFAVPEDAVEVVAEDIAFEPNEFALPADEVGHILFRNEDANVPHDVDIYPLADGEPDLEAEPVLDSEPFPGVAQRVLEVEPPEEPGEYYFYCSVHPSMNGTVTFE